MNSATLETPIEIRDRETHPRGLYVLFATEMWERFSFYTMLSMFTLYLQNAEQGFGWTSARATSLYSSYLACVYLSPLLGGWLADRKLGYRRSVMIGAVFFMAGHLLLSFRSLPILYAALACLVIGNGFFKPNVSTMVGNLYAEGSHLKDRAYTIFYMGISVGAFLAPLVAEFVSRNYGFHPAFVVAGGGMLISVMILWRFRQEVEDPGSARAKPASPLAQAAGKARADALSAIPDARRIGALGVVFLIVIVYWMIVFQNGSTFTYWANDNTDWEWSGVISNAINPFWIIALTWPVIRFWQWLDRRGLEPSTPAKMALGMLLIGLAFYLMACAGKAGGDHSKVSPWWLIISYAVISLGELMVSPMGLSLVSKVAPVRMRGLMMGGWFISTAIGNKLTAIGVYWDVWLHSTFFAVLGTLAIGTAILLMLLLKPLKRAMPGV
ncbi:MAG: peptide MFS transporter [Blastocatellia bacterium]